MKKSIKAIIITSAVAAVAGIGAVSFAKWEGTATSSVPISGTTGVINTLGDITVTPKADTYTTGADDAITMNPLYPVDQGGSYLTYWEFTVSTATGTGTATPTYKLAGSLTKGSGTDVNDAKLYWTTTTPTSATTAVVANELNGTAKTLTGVSSGDKVYVYMVADGTDAMSATISLTFEQV